MKALSLFLFMFVMFAALAQKAGDTTVTSDPDHVYEVVDVDAAPAGGMSFYQFVADNLDYPADARRKNISGNVIVQFVIEKDGKILPENVTVVKPLHRSIDKEARRIVLLSSPWQPAQKGGKAVRSRRTLPITFRL